eukprot:1370541-Prymnesium_polylepis.2
MAGIACSARHARSARADRATRVRKQTVDGSPDGSAFFTYQPAVSLATTAGNKVQVELSKVQLEQSTHPPTGYQGRYREWCAATQSSARAGGQPR